MKRVNLQDYFELAQALSAAKQAFSGPKMKGGAIVFGLMGVNDPMQRFVQADNGFSTSKHAASDLLSVSRRWADKVMPGGEYVAENFDREHDGWEYGEVGRGIEAFRSVFQHECRDVDVYSVDQISIYRTSSLVARGDDILPPDIKATVSQSTRDEFTSAAKCLAFDLPTACGFHALRALELVMDDYLTSFEVKTSAFKSWNDYIKAAEALIGSKDAKRKPSKKVAAMLDRMRELDRNPLMHPRDTLDEVGADQLFKLCSITVTEMVREMVSSKAVEAATQALIETATA